MTRPRKLPWSLKPGKGHRSRADRKREQDLAREWRSQQQKAQRDYPGKPGHQP